MKKDGDHENLCREGRSVCVRQRERERTESGGVSNNKLDFKWAAAIFMFPRPWPLILLLKVRWKQGKVLGSEDKALEGK
jgi:hypothetical protein